MTLLRAKLQPDDLFNAILCVVDLMDRVSRELIRLTPHSARSVQASLAMLSERTRSVRKKPTRDSARELLLLLLPCFCRSLSASVA